MMSSSVTDVPSTFIRFTMQRVITRSRLRIPHFRLRILHFWCVLILLQSTANAPNTLETRTNAEMPKEIQETRQLTTSVRTKETRDTEARQATLYKHSRVLNQQQDGSTIKEQSSCSLSATLISTFYDEFNQTWTITNALLSEIDNVLQQIVDCAVENDTIYLRTNGSIEPATTINVSIPLTLRGAPGTTLTCPQRKELLVSSSSRFAMEDIVVSGCNGSSSIIFLHPNCSTGMIQEAIVLSGVTFVRNTVFEGAHIIDANTSCSELKFTGVEFRRNKCVGTHCVFLGRRNTLRDVHLRRNDGSSNTSQDSSIFFANEGSENVLVNMTSKRNAIRSIQVFNGTLSITNSHFEDNNATFAAAFLLNSTPSAYIDRCTFVRNSGYNRSGGSIRARASNVNILSSTFLENNAFACGSISVFGRCNSSVVDSVFDNNTAAGFGGAICAGSNTSLVLSNSSFEGNHGGWGGALFAYYASNISIMGANFVKNNASNGGCVELYHSRTTMISNSNFSDNKAERSGGAIALHNTSKLLIYGSMFVGNQAGSEGGAIDLNNANVSLMDVQLKFNRARRGGGIYPFNASYISATNVSVISNNAEVYGGGIVATYASRINGRNLIIVSNIAGAVGGGIALFNSSSLLCYSCTFLNNSAFRGAGLYAHSDQFGRYTSWSRYSPVVIQLQSCRFGNNSAQSYGGGIDFAVLKDEKDVCRRRRARCGRMILLNTSFEDNYAEISGAVVLTTAPNRVLLDCDHRIRRQQFLNKTYFNSLDIINPEHMCASWKRNRVSSSESGDAIGTYGQKIDLSITLSDDVRLVRRKSGMYLLENVSGGKQLPDIIVTILDEFGKGPAPTLPSSFDARMSSPDKFFRGENVANITAGTGTFPNVVGFVSPGNYTIEITSNNRALRNIRVKVLVRECRVGEEPTKDRRTCQDCDAFTYNFNPSIVGGCTECPEGGNCSGRFIVPKKGYWHNSPCHDQVKECLVEEACTYENRTRDLTTFTQDFTDCQMDDTTLKAYHAKQCNEGHEGPLCGSCNASYGLSFRFQCLKCPRNGVDSFLVVLGVTLYLLALAAFTIKGCLPIDKKKAQNRSIRVPSNASFGASNQDPEVNIEMVRMIVEGHVPPEYFQRRQEEASTSQAPEESVETENQYDLTKWKTTEVFKIMINFLQTTTVAATLDLDWTDGMNGLFEASEFIGAIATSAVSGPIDCLASSTSKVMRAVCKMLINMFVPAFVMLMFAALWGLLALRNGEDMSYFGRRTVLSIIAVTYISYLGLTKVAVRAFYCVDVYDSDDHLENSKTQYLAVDTSIECYKNGHFGLVAIAVIVLGVVTVSFPLVSAFILSRNKQRHMQKDSWTFETAGFLFRAFKESCLFWESVVMFRKACLSVIVVFSYLLEGQSQGILASVVLLLCLYAHLTIRPYREDFKILNHFESASLLVSCLTFTLGLFFAKNSTSGSVRAFLSVLIILVNILFFIFLLSAFVMSGIGHLRVVLQSENLLLPDQVPWWRVLKIFVITRFLNWFKLSSQI